MNLKQFYIGLGVVIYLILVLGIVGPWLLSAKSTVAFLIGLALIVGPLVVVAHKVIGRKQSAE